MELNNWPTRAADIARWAQGDWNRKPDREQTQWMAQRMAMLEAKCARLEQDRDFLDHIEAIAEQMKDTEDWKKGSPVNERTPPEQKEQPPICKHCGESGVGCNQFGCWTNGKTQEQP